MYSSTYLSTKSVQGKISLDTFENIITEIHNIFDPATRDNLSPTSTCFLAQK